MDKTALAKLGFAMVCSVLLGGMVLMFAAPFVGLSFGYWAGVLICYAIEGMIGAGVMFGIQAAQDV